MIVDLPRLNPPIVFSYTGVEALWVLYTTHFRELPDVLVAPNPQNDELAAVLIRFKMKLVAWQRSDYLLVGPSGIVWSGPL